MIKVFFKFEEDAGSEYAECQNIEYELREIPKTGEIVRINEFWHPVVYISHHARSTKIVIGLGKSADSAKDAMIHGAQFMD